MGYTLTNGSMGVFFNDNTKISLAPDNFSIEYIIKNDNKQELKNLYNFKEYPQELKKKVTLLVWFKN